MLDTLTDILSRQWTDLLARPSGPMAFRFLLQPSMAALLAIRDGLQDVRIGRAPYFWTVRTHPHERMARLREGLAATSRIILLGLAMDAIYQFIAFRKFYPFEAIIVAVGLAFIPYLLIRGPTTRIARRCHRRRGNRLRRASQISE